MTQERHQRSPQFKFKVALEAAKERRTVNQLSSEYGPHPIQVELWKQLTPSKKSGLDFLDTLLFDKRTCPKKRPFRYTFWSRTPTGTIPAEQ